MLKTVSTNSQQIQHIMLQQEEAALKESCKRKFSQDSVAC